MQVNIYVGVGLLSMPYAMRLAGWSGLLGLLAAVCLFGTSALLVVRAFDKLDSGTPHTFPALGEVTPLPLEATHTSGIQGSCPCFMTWLLECSMKVIKPGMLR